MDLKKLSLIEGSTLKTLILYGGKERPAFHCKKVLTRYEGFDII